jgi:DUF917 family protein
MGTGIGQFLLAVVTPSYDVPLVDGDCTNRNFPSLAGNLGFVEGLAHVLLVLCFSSYKAIITHRAPEAQTYVIFLRKTR